MPNNSISVMWFRHDLRLSDNLALYELSKRESKVLPIYIFEHEEKGISQSASSWWLHKSLTKLSNKIPLRCFKGDPVSVLSKISAQHKVARVYWNTVFEPNERHLSQRVLETLGEQMECAEFNSSLLVEPSEMTNNSGGFYSVFTPFWKACTTKLHFRMPIPKPKTIFANLPSLGLHILDLDKSSYHWMDSLNDHWKIGEEAALEKVRAFAQDKLDNYSSARDIPGLTGTSLLSPHLHFGEISPHIIWHEIKQNNSKGADVFRSELGWREFSYYLLHHFPTLPTHNFRTHFNEFEWINDEQQLALWKLGKTGVPIIDAGMRELWQTGYMHNRVRMIVASFLTKHLLIDWRKGAEWFMYTLLDADLANNSASWQWVAGSGADAAPYFRIFNPVLQGEKFDPDGKYVRKFVPEIKQLPNEYIHKPWLAPPITLAQYGINLGFSYPKPVVDLKYARERALRHYKALPKQLIY